VVDTAVEIIRVGQVGVEPSQAVEPDATLFVTPTGFVTSSFGGETALSLTRQMSDAIHTPPSLPPDDVRSRIRSVLGVQESRGEALAARVLATIKKPGYRAEQFEFTSEREIRTPGWLLTPDSSGPSTPTLLYVGEPAAWSSVAEDAFAERLCATGRCRVAVIDVRGRGDTAIGYPPRGRFYFPGRITDEAYVAWFMLMLGKPLLGGQLYDTLRALDHFQSVQAPRDERLCESIDLVNSRRGSDGRWSLEYAYSGKTHFNLEPLRAPSRWNTLRALRVLKWWNEGPTGHS